MMRKLVMALCVVSVLSGAVWPGAGDSEQRNDVETQLSALSGVHGLNRAGVCVLNEVPVRRCEAVLVAKQWAVTPPRCVLGASAGNLRVVRNSDGLSCADVEAGVHTYGIRRVFNIMHPSPDHDLALLSLDRPYITVDRHSNTSYVNRFLKEWEPWMVADFRQELRSRPMSLGHTHMLLSTPMRMLVTTVVLPTLSFIVLFMFVVFCTGPRDPIPYQAIKETETEKTDSLSV